MSRAWMPMYWGDYLADTHHYTRAEHGGYLLLIAYYWCNGGLPNDEDQIRKIAKCSPLAWSSFKLLMRKHFSESWTHKRIDAELAKVIDKSKVNSANAMRRHHPVAADPQCHSHSHSDIEENIYPSKPKDDWPKDYRERFWQAYPRKVGKGSAIRKLEAVRAKGETSFAQLLSAIRKIEATEEKFIPHPTTWLNQGRYLDNQATGPPLVSGPPPGAPSNDELMRRYSNGIDRGTVEETPAETQRVLAESFQLRKP